MLILLAFLEQLWEHSDAYTPETWEWNRPKLGGSGRAGFRSFDVVSCNSRGGFGADAGQGGRNGKNYNSIIEYKNQYYFLVLHQPISAPHIKPIHYWLEIQSIASNGSKEMTICDWTPVTLTQPKVPESS